MASSKNPHNYAFALWELVRIFDTATNAAPVILPFSSHNEAEGFRFNYYGFKNALKAEGNELAATASAILVKLVRHEGTKRCDLEFSLRDNQSANLALEEILRARQAEQPETEASPEPHPPESQSHDDVLNDFLLKK